MRLIKYDEVMASDYYDYAFEWERLENVISPYTVGRNKLDFRQVMERWKKIEQGEMVNEGMVASTLFFLLDTSDYLVGAIDVRHELNDYLLQYGGHIGYGIRPTQRCKGYGKAILEHTLKHITMIKEKKILVTCNDDNIASAKIIEYCGGKMENKVIENDELIRRYWIEK